MKPLLTIVIAVTLLALLPWVSSFHPSTLFPNQSAWRFLGWPCAVLALIWLSKQPRGWWGTGLGLAMGWLALCNPETAVASAAGVFVFFVLRSQNVCFALIFVVPAITENIRATQRVLDEGFSPPPVEVLTEVVSGVLLPTAVARALQEKAAYLVRTPDSFYLTTNAYTMPMLAGRFPDSPLGDAFAESMTPADTQRLVTWIRERRAARLLFDDPESLLTPSTPQQRYYERVRASFAGEYEVEGATSGWLVLRRSSP